MTIIEKSTNHILHILYGNGLISDEQRRRIFEEVRKTFCEWCGKPKQSLQQRCKCDERQNRK